MHGILNVRMGQRRMEIRVNPERKSTTYWFHILLYLVFAATGLGMFGASFFIPAR